jgi:hypothetical protein
VDVELDNAETWILSTTPKNFSREQKGPVDRQDEDVLLNKAFWKAFLVFRKAPASMPCWQVFDPKINVGAV